MSTPALQKEFQALPNLYEFMGVLPGVDPASLRKAFKTLTFKYHPDLNTDVDASSKFVVLKRANEVLSDASMKLDYDKFLRAKEEVKASKANISEKRKYFSDLLKKREDEYRQSRSTQDTAPEDIVEEFLRKKRMSKKVEKIYDFVGQSEVNEVLDGQRKNRDELRRMLATIKVKWTNTGKAYTKVLLRMIFGRFGEISDMQFIKEDHKCFIQYTQVARAELAIKYFADKTDFSIKYLLTENRAKCIEKVADKSTGFELSSDILNKISGVYNGYSYDSRRSQLDREIERQRQMKKLIETQLSQKDQ